MERLPDDPSIVVKAAEDFLREELRRLNSQVMSADEAIREFEWIISTTKSQSLAENYAKGDTWFEKMNA